MESKRVQRLKLTMHPLTFPLFLCLLTTALVSAMTPYIATAAIFNVDATDNDVFFPNGVNSGEIFTINSGDTVHWRAVGDAPHTVSPGDYLFRTCSSAPGFGGILLSNFDTYDYTFTTAQMCYYRCEVHPSAMQGLIHVASGPITTTTTTTTSTTTTTLNHPPSLDSLTPVNISTEPSVVQSFTAGYSDPDGYLNITDASLFLSGSTHNEWIHYSPQTNRFTMMGVAGNCSPGQATTLSNSYLILNCGSSSASGSGPNLTVIYNLTPQPPISGAGYRLILAAVDQGGSNVNKDMGYWVVNRRPTACSAVPMNSTTPVGTPQTFVCQYSDPDGYQNIAEANFYLAGGLHNEWLHYVSAANIFFIMGAPGVCIPGQATMLSNGYLTFDCAASSVSGLGNTLTVTFRVTPEAPSSGINYNIFTGASDQAGAAHGAFGGTWQIP